MFTLPFHVENPLATSFVVGGVAIVFGLLKRTYSKKSSWLYKLMLWFFLRRFHNVEPEKAETFGGYFLSFMTLVFASMSILQFSIGTGIIRNGPQRIPPQSKEALILQQYLQNPNSKTEIEEMFRQVDPNDKPR